MTSTNDSLISLTAPTAHIPKARGSKRTFAHQAPQKTAWLMTFTDTVALMLTFFVMTYSMANPKHEIWEDIREQVNMEFSKNLGQVAQRGEVNDISLERIKFENALNLSYLEALLTNQLIRRELNDKVHITAEPEEHRLILTVPQKFLFASGSAIISDKNKHVVQEISSILKGIKNSIEVVGHTDPSPVHQNNPQFRSNWDLSLQRAVNFSALMKKNGYEHPMHIRGAASGLYNSLPETLSIEARKTISRRVDIIIYDKKEDFMQRIQKR
ncbi:MAG: OmpA family protein [Alphaproteobacteria bacterium]|nr:OmpA family protein [Alphaproteobacteria bacterium]